MLYYYFPYFVYSIKTTITKLKEKLEYQEHQHKRQVLKFLKNFNIDFVNDRLKMKCMECYKRKQKKEVWSRKVLYLALLVCIRLYHILKSSRRLTR